MKIKSLLFGHNAWLVFVLAVLVRVIYNFTVAAAYIPSGDSVQYLHIGQHIVHDFCYCEHPGVQTVYRAPLWPIILGPISLFDNGHALVARLFLCLVGSGTCVLIYHFAKDLWNMRVGLSTGIIAACYPALFIFDGWLYAESLYTFLLIACCYTFYRLQCHFQRRLLVLAGVLLALLTLTRPNGLLVLGAFVCWLVFLGCCKMLPWRRIVQSVVVVSCIVIIIIAPWAARNYSVSHSFVLVATGDGTVFLGAYNDQILSSPGDRQTWSNPLHSTPAISAPFPKTTCDGACEVKREEVYKEATLVWVASHLLQMPTLLTNHFLNMWTPTAHESDLPLYRYNTQISTQVVLFLMRILPIPVFILAAWGIWVTRRFWRELSFLYVIIGLTIIQCLIFYGIPRFRAPIEPMLMLLLGGSLWWIQQSRFSLRRGFHNDAEQDLATH